MNISVVGTGYVGLTTGACFADVGYHVRCCDVAESVVASLRKGELHVFEPGLSELVQRNSEKGRLEFTTDVEQAVRASSVVFVTVGTPSRDDGSADVEPVLSATATIARAMDGDRIVVIKSTSPIGTTARVRDLLATATPHRAEVCVNPEFLSEGTAVADFMRPERVILGTESELAERELRALYEPFMPPNGKFVMMSTISAEVLKYAANAMLAGRVSLMNLVAQLCAKVGANIGDVQLGVGLDSRIGPRFLEAGAGYGGSCLPKDVDALARMMRAHGVEASLVEAIGSVNERQKRALLTMIAERFDEELSGRAFAVWGLAFKPGTDDMRAAPSLVTIRGLIERGARVAAHDPAAMGRAAEALGCAVQCKAEPYDVLAGADALVIHSGWSVYRNPDFSAMRGLMRRPLVFDGRNLYEPADMARRGFEYHSIGRPHVAAEEVA